MNNEEKNWTTQELIELIRHRSLHGYGSNELFKELYDTGYLEKLFSDIQIFGPKK